MIHNILWLASIGIAALLPTAIVGWWRKKSGPSISGWWDAEGFVVWLLVAVALFLLACGFGVFGIEGN